MVYFRERWKLIFGKELHKNLIGYKLIIFLFLKVFSIIINENLIGGGRNHGFILTHLFLLYYHSHQQILDFDNFLSSPMLSFYFKPMHCLCFLLIIIFDLIYIVIFRSYFSLSWACFSPTVFKSYMALAFSSLYWPSSVILLVVTLNKYLTFIVWTLVLHQTIAQT